MSFSLYFSLPFPFPSQALKIQSRSPGPMGSPGLFLLLKKSKRKLQLPSGLAVPRNKTNARSPSAALLQLSPVSKMSEGDFVLIEMTNFFKVTTQNLNVQLLQLLSFSLAPFKVFKSRNVAKFSEKGTAQPLPGSRLNGGSEADSTLAQRDEPCQALMQLSHLDYNWNMRVSPNNRGYSIARGYLQEFEGKILLLKTSHTSDTNVEEQSWY